MAVAEDVRGGTDQVTVAGNRALAAALTDSLAAWLGERGYTVDQTYPGSVGLYLSPMTRVHLRADEGAPVDSAAAPPFFVDPAVRADTVLLAALDGAMGARSPLTARTEQPEAFVLLLVRGRRVSVGKSIGQGILTGILSLGTVSVYEVSGVAVELVVVDGATGQLLWRDVAAVQNSASDGTVHKLVRRLAGRLPDRPPAGSPAASASR